MDYNIKIRTFKDGERYCVLRGKDGQPILEVVHWVNSTLRSSSAMNTIKQALIAIKSMFVHFDQVGIDLNERLSKGNFLSREETEALFQKVSLKLGAFNKVKEDYSKGVVDLAIARKKRRGHDRDDLLDKAAAGNRISTITNFLSFYVQKFINSKDMADGLRLTLKEQKQDFLDYSKVIKPNTRISEKDAVLSIEKNDLQKVLNKVNKTSAENPFQREATRVRNELIIKLLLHTGIRMGELLNIEVKDIDFSKRTLSIIRKPNNLKDLRRNQPCVKTKERVLELDEVMLEALGEYITRYRPLKAGARKHNFLIVSTLSGHPLSLNAIQKLFTKLRLSDPGIPKNLSAHKFRHTWNEHFSELMDRHNVPEVEEAALRRVLQGWSITSNMPNTYLRRKTMKKANAFFVKNSEELSKMGKH